MINSRKNKACRVCLLDEGGYSLIELVVVMAIIAVTITFFLMGIRLIFSMPPRQCARELKAALEKTRIDTMGRNAAGLRVFRTEKGIFISLLETKDDGKTLNPEHTEKIAPARVKLDFQEDGVGSWDTLENGEGDRLVISFKRETGGLYGKDDGTHTIGEGSLSYTSKPVKYIWTSGGGSVWRVSIAQLTGMVEVKKVSYVGDTSD